MEKAHIDMADLHEALFHAMTSPMVAVDRDGSVVEWNHAAEECTGIRREDAIGSAVWNLQARVAPAAIPYERALEASQESFKKLVTMSGNSDSQWPENYESGILTPGGEYRRIHSQIFPLWIRRELFIVGVLTPLNRPQLATVSTEYAMESVGGS